MIWSWPAGEPGVIRWLCWSSGVHTGPVSTVSFASLTLLRNLQRSRHPNAPHHMSCLSYLHACPCLATSVAGRRLHVSMILERHTASKAVKNWHWDNRHAICTLYFIRPRHAQRHPSKYSSFWVCAYGRVHTESRNQATILCVMKHISPAADNVHHRQIRSHRILIVKCEHTRRVVVINWQSQGTFGSEAPPLPPASDGGPKRPLSLNKIPGVAYIGEVWRLASHTTKALSRHLPSKCHKITRVVWFIKACTALSSMHLHHLNEHHLNDHIILMITSSSWTRALAVV